MIALGEAFWSVQVLEGGLLTLHELLDLKRDKDAAMAKKSFDDRSYHSTLGELFAELRARKYITDANKKVIHAGIHARNSLVHLYWLSTRSLKLETASGCSWLRRDLKRLNDAIWDASQVLLSMVNPILKERGESAESLASHYEAKVLRQTLRRDLIKGGLTPSMIEDIKWLRD